MTTTTEIATASTQPALPEMTPDEAQETIRKIRTGWSSLKTRAADLRRLVVDFEERKGWQAAGHSSMLACAKAEFGLSTAHFYRMLDAAAVDRARGLSIGETPESHAREVRRLPASEQREVLDAVGNGKASDVKAEVERRQPRTASLPDFVGDENERRKRATEPWPPGREFCVHGRDLIGEPCEECAEENAHFDIEEPEQTEVLPGIAAPEAPQDAQSLDSDTPRPDPRPSGWERPSAPTIRPQGPDRHPATTGGRDKQATVETAGAMDPEDLDWLVTPIERTALRNRKASLGDVLAAYWRLVARAEAEQDTRARMVARAILKGGD